MDKPPKQVAILAVVGVIIITAAAVAALAYSVVVNDGSTDALTTIAAVGLGGLVTALGGKAAQLATDRSAPDSEPATTVNNAATYGPVEPVDMSVGTDDDLEDDPIPDYDDSRGFRHSPENGPDQPMTNAPGDGTPPAGEF